MIENFFVKRSKIIAELNDEVKKETGRLQI